MQTGNHDYSHPPVDLPADEDEPLDGATGVEELRLDAHGAQGERLDRFLARALPQYSRSRLQKWIAIGAVRCDERPAPAKTRLSGLEQITVAPQPIEAEQAFVAEPVPLEIVHADPSIFVIDKPAGLVVHPAAGNWGGTLLNGLLHLDPRQASLPRAGIVHRLDKDTSGLMVVARTEAARAALVAQLSDRSMSRRYLAIAGGRCAPGGHIDAPIGRDPANRLRMAVVDAARGRPAQTDYRLLRSGRLDGRDLSLVECRLYSGRTHQIRVHMRSIGHPLAGDALYNGQADARLLRRQMLHAWRLSLRHPEGGDWQTWRSRPPADFRAVLAAAAMDMPDLLERAEIWSNDD